MKLVNALRQRAHSNGVWWLVLVIQESGHAQDARCIGGGWVGAERARKPSLERLGIVERETFDLPDDLELPRGRVENTVGLGRVVPSLEARERRFGVPVEVEIEVAEVGDVRFRPTLSLRFESVHADVDLEALVILASKPLERLVGDAFSGDDSLDDAAGTAVQQEQQEQSVSIARA